MRKGSQSGFHTFRSCINEPHNKRGTGLQWVISSPKCEARSGVAERKPLEFGIRSPETTESQAQCLAHSGKLYMAELGAASSVMGGNTAPQNARWTLKATFPTHILVPGNTKSFQNFWKQFTFQEAGRSETRRAETRGETNAGETKT